MLVSTAVSAPSAKDAAIGVGAIDARGVRHRAIDYQGKLPPWIRDVMAFVRPQYNSSDRMSHRQGLGVFRITIDVKTGLVSGVTMLESTGDPTLNRSVLAALPRWRWKPGTWKEVVLPVDFRLQMPAGAIPLRLPLPR